MSERMPEDMPDRMPEGMPDRMSDRIPEGMPDKVPECFPDRTPEDLPDRMPDRMSEDMPDRVPEDMPEHMPEDMLGRMPEDMPDRMPEDMPDKMPEDMPDRMPEVMPDRMSDRIPEGMPDKVPECLPEHMPEDLPDRMSEAMPENMPDRVPEDMPGRMPDRMPEDMPDKMPEDMPDRMPEDLPVTKPIDVMVGITRSKVISCVSPLEARVLAKSLEDDGKKESSRLNQQIAIAEHCGALLGGAILKRMPRHELAAHLQAIKEDEIKLPLSIRCKLLLRRTNDLALDLTTSSPENSEKAAHMLARVLRAWASPDQECDDTQVQFNNVWAAEVASVNNQVMKGDISEAQKEEELEKIAGDRLGLGGVGNLKQLSLFVSCLESRSRSGPFFRFLARETLSVLCKKK